VYHIFFYLFLVSFIYTGFSFSSSKNNIIHNKKKISMKAFLRKNQIPVYDAINRTNLRSINALFNSLYSPAWNDPEIENKSEIQYKNFCFFSINLFYATKNKGIFSIENYLKMKDSQTVQSRVFRCIFSDVNLDGFPDVAYTLNKNIYYNVEILSKTPRKFHSKDPIISSKMLAQSLKNTASGIKKDMTAREIIATNVKTIFKNDRMTEKAVDSVMNNDRKTLGSALLFIGLREGLTEEQKKKLASKMTDIATRLNMKPIREAVDAYLHSNVRIYIDNGNNFLVNYRLEF